MLGQKEKIISIIILMLIPFMVHSQSLDSNKIHGSIFNFSPGPINHWPKENKKMLSLPENYYTYSLGFFCRQELKLQQKSIPLKFRVGSMENCNYLEGKIGK